MTTLWNVTAPDYVAPSTTVPNWIWTIIGWGRNDQDNVDVVVLRLDYVMRDANGNFVRVLNYRPGWQSGACTQYIPIMMYLNEGTAGGAGNSFSGGYDYFMTETGVNNLWKNYIYKFLNGLKYSETGMVYIPLVGTP